MNNYCDQHQNTVGSDCPYCVNEKLTYELKMIQESFVAAIKSKTNKGGQQVPYHGDFANISPSVIRDMTFYLERWEQVLK